MPSRRRADASPGTRALFRRGDRRRRLLRGLAEQLLARPATGEQREVILDLRAGLQPREFTFIDDPHVLDRLTDFLGERIDHGLVERFFVAILVRCLHCAPNATHPAMTPRACRSFLSEVFLAEISGNCREKCTAPCERLSPVRFSSFDDET